MVYTVKQLADLAGVSNRTLHYYDEIGLLKSVSGLGGGDVADPAFAESLLCGLEG